MKVERPSKYSIFGVKISATTYKNAVDAIIKAAKLREKWCVSALAVHGLVSGVLDSHLWSILNDFDLLTPDGQPIRLALNYLYRLKLSDRVYGPFLMMHICQRAMEENISIYLYGSHKNVITPLKLYLLKRFPELRIAGCEPSVFRPLTEIEDQDFVRRITASGAGIVFIGLGCPLQEKFAHAHRQAINAVQVCVGAAFDFHAGKKKMAPAWMQRNGLEWLYRLTQEPRRLWRRYLFTNGLFVVYFLMQALKIKKF